MVREQMPLRASQNLKAEWSVYWTDNHSCNYPVCQDISIPVWMFDDIHSTDEAAVAELQLSQSSVFNLLACEPGDSFVQLLQRADGANDVFAVAVA